MHFLTNLSMRIGFDKYKINDAVANKVGIPRQQVYRAKAIRARLQKSMHLAIVGNLNERSLAGEQTGGRIIRRWCSAE